MSTVVKESKKEEYGRRGLLIHTARFNADCTSDIHGPSPSSWSSAGQILLAKSKSQGSSQDDVERLQAIFRGAIIQSGNLKHKPKLVVYSCQMKGVDSPNERLICPHLRAFFSHPKKGRSLDITNSQSVYEMVRQPGKLDTTSFSCMTNFCDDFLFTSFSKQPAIFYMGQFYSRSCSLGVSLLGADTLYSTISYVPTAFLLATMLLPDYTSEAFWKRTAYSISSSWRLYPRRII